jgi:hypothetical protein
MRGVHNSYELFRIHMKKNKKKQFHTGKPTKHQKGRSISAGPDRFAIIRSLIRGKPKFLPFIQGQANQHARTSSDGRPYMTRVATALLHRAKQAVDSGGPALAWDQAAPLKWPWITSCMEDHHVGCHWPSSLQPAAVGRPHLGQVANYVAGKMLVNRQPLFTTVFRLAITFSASPKRVMLIVMHYLGSNNWTCQANARHCCCAPASDLQHCSTDVLSHCSQGVIQ